MNPRDNGRIMNGPNPTSDIILYQAGDGRNRIAVRNSRRAGTPRLRLARRETMTATRHTKSESDAVQIVEIPVEDRIFTLRGDKVILDGDLAATYGVETKRLNEQVRRNADRFPSDFAFVLTAQEARSEKP